jgi:hypothetical protein
MFKQGEIIHDSKDFDVRTFMQTSVMEKKNPSCIISTIDLKNVEEVFRKCIQEPDTHMSLGHCMFNFQYSVKDATDVLNMALYAFNILKSYGYEVEKPTVENIEKIVNIEYHIYMNNTDRKIIASQFSKHKDNEGATDYNVHTCIWYFDHTFNLGGEVIINPDNESNMIVFDPRRFNLLLLNGNTEHLITKCHGKGLRRCLVFQIKAME